MCSVYVHLGWPQGQALQWPPCPPIRLRTPVLPAPAPPADGTLFEPAITKAAAARRHAKWKLAVQRSFGLADLTRDLEEDSEQRQAGAAGSGSRGLAPSPRGPCEEGDGPATEAEVLG